MTKLPSMRREYGKKDLLEKNISPNPFTQFAAWFQEATDANLLDANAMVLATVDQQGYPDSRVVLLKDFSSEGFVFFTHYNSHKAQQIETTDVVALNFYWREFAKQVRIRGKIARVAREESVEYFASRPRESQLCTLASHQSNILTNREEIENRVNELTAQYEGQSIPCPPDWGGYRVIPFEFEFFQGRDNRLNDRIRYQLIATQWKIERLSP